MTPLWRDHFPHQTFLPRYLETAEELEPGERIPGLVDETN